MQESGGGAEASGPGVHVTVSPAVLEQIRVRAEGAYPEECCGFLIGLREGGSVLVHRTIPCAGAAVSPDGQRRLAIHPRALITVLRSLGDRDEGVVGFYHSHPDADDVLSPTDLTFGGFWPDTVWLVVPVGEEGAGEERAWWLPSAGPATAAPLDLPPLALESVIWS